MQSTFDYLLRLKLWDALSGPLACLQRVKVKTGNNENEEGGKKSGSSAESYSGRVDIVSTSVALHTAVL